MMMKMMNATAVTRPADFYPDRTMRFEKMTMSAAMEQVDDQAVIGKYLGDQFRRNHRTPSFVLRDSEDIHSVLSALSDEKSTDPPASANELPDVSSYVEEYVEAARTVGFHRRGISANHEVNLAMSPLTASSAHIMERQYDLDTWRMFSRIHAARNQASSPRSELSKETLDHTTNKSMWGNQRLLTEESDMFHVVSFTAGSDSTYQLDESDAIFDLELDGL